MMNTVVLLQQTIAESVNRQSRYMQFGYHTSSNTPALYQTDCSAFCQNFMLTGLGSGPFPWWGKCFNAGSLLNNVPAASSQDHLIPPATKRLRNYTECLRTPVTLHYIFLDIYCAVCSSGQYLLRLVSSSVVLLHRSGGLHEQFGPDAVRRGHSGVQN